LCLLTGEGLICVLGFFDKIYHSHLIEEFVCWNNIELNSGLNRDSEGNIIF